MRSRCASAGRRSRAFHGVASGAVGDALHVMDRAVLAPEPREVESGNGPVVATAYLGRLHHRYARAA